ncbi:hypothetical protein H312_01594 [Anncaliia algerae PRA339]|uniref:Uncharacterized protein n=1 Tax=Anncaliia algerae PRA339 TaxID=1288291 RepID=A0A059F1W2_9MICR|nr:hypothetical protein H312_01594 [Anncaliia algerae PRA339]
MQINDFMQPTTDNSDILISTKCTDHDCYFPHMGKVTVMIRKSAEEILNIAVENIKKYQKKYGKIVKNKENFKIDEEVWYIDFKDRKGKLEPLWLYKGKIVEVGFNSCKILNKDGKRIW